MNPQQAQGWGSGVKIPNRINKIKIKILFIDSFSIQLIINNVYSKICLIIDFVFATNEHEKYIKQKIKNKKRKRKLKE